MIKRLLALREVKHSHCKPLTLRMFLLALFTLRDGFRRLFLSFSFLLGVGGGGGEATN